MEAKELIKNPDDITPEILTDLSDLVLDELNDLAEDSKAFNDNVQYGKKIDINSLYGMIGATASIFYDTRIPSSITSYGRFFIRFIANVIDKKIREIAPDEYKSLNVSKDKPLGSSWIYTHTDSDYFEFFGLRQKYIQENPNATEEEIVKYLIDKGEEFANLINEKLTPLILDLFNKHSNEMSMNFEVFADKGLVLKKARYYLRKIMDDGKILASPKFKVTGMEIKKASTPKLTKELVDKDKYNLYLDGSKEAIISFHKYAKEQFMSSDVSKILKPINVKKISEFEITDRDMGIFKENIKNFSMSRRKYNEDKSDLKKYVNIISVILSKLGSGNEDFKVFIYNLNAWMDRISLARDDEKNINLSKSLTDLFRLDFKINSANNTKDGEDHTLSESDFKKSFYSLFNKKDYISSYKPKIEFIKDINSKIIKGLSFNSKIAVIHNLFLEENRDKFPLLDPIRDGDKVAWCFLKKPNPFFNTDRICIKDNELLPIIEKYIDRDMQYKSGFKDVVGEISEAVGVKFGYNPKMNFI